MLISVDTLARLNALDPETRAIAIGAFGREPIEEDTAAEGVRLAAILDALDAGAGNVAAIEAVANAVPFGTDPGDVPLLSTLLRERIKALTDQERDTFVEAWKASGLTMRLAEDGADVVLSPTDYKGVEALLAEHEPRPTDDTMSKANGALITALSTTERQVLEHRLAAIGIDPTDPAYFSTVGRQYAVNRMATEWAEELAANAADAEARKATLPEADAEPTTIVREPVADAADLDNAVPEKVTMAELLEWVGEDKARATKALAAEQARAKPRKGVVARCNVVLATSVGDPAATPEPDVDAEPEAADEGEKGEPDNVVDISTGKPVPSEAHPSMSLESRLFREVPTSEWGPLTRAAYLSRLAAEMEVAAAILTDLAKEQGATS